MASQGRVTDFFSTRKRNPGLQPSKRRKVEIQATEVDISSLDKTNIDPYKNLIQETVDQVSSPVDDKKENVFSPLQTRAARKSKAKSVTQASKKTTRVRNTKVDPKQKLISDTFSSPAPAESVGQTKSQVVAEVTSSEDNHDTPPVAETPKKMGTEKGAKSRKRTRQAKAEQVEETKPDEATPEKCATPVEKPALKGRAKKKLELIDLKNDGKESDQAPMEVPPSVSKPKGPDVIAAALEKAKSLKSKKPAQMTAQDVKAKLAKVTNLDDLKNRLSKMKETREKIKTPSLKLKKFDKIEVEVESEVKPKVPAYERFHHLATTAAPTLSLPYKYRLLAEHFRGMDQVVSMLHNRNEVCTFSKLKVAVQELNKKNFEERHVGQIKTVFPEAYELRQEKGLQNMQGFKSSGYQLTIEARLHEEDSKAQPTFKASHLLTRRNHFHNSLINIVKKHHKEFLSNLDRPLSVPDDKVTRWHPRFPLDEVDDIIESPLPRSPDIQTYQTAKDVLESTRGKLMPKVEAALKLTADEVSKATSAPAVSPAPVSTPSKPSASMTGVPQSLLEKIRAKEAANAVASLTRDPKAEKKLGMMKRLPDIMRIIRSHFVTEKKPALPIDSVIQRVLDSYKNAIAPGDVEPHINLCKEVAPEWLTSIQIQKGRYLKIDRNIDLQTLTDRVNNLIKGKQ